MLSIQTSYAAIAATASKATYDVFAKFFDVFATFFDVFGPVFTHSDTFGYIRMLSAKKKMVKKFFEKN